jgi:membrane-associated protease RseP (regulator of RpoE activity)
MTESLGVLIFVLVLLIVVMIHEAGHFFTAKAFKIKVEEFFVGFGPRLLSFRRGETEYGVKALPFGGYVRIAGMNPFQESPPEDLPRTFGAKPIWQRAIVIATGPFTHFAMAILFLSIYSVTIGARTPTRPVIDQVEAQLDGQTSPAAIAGLREGDEVIAVDGRPVENIDRFIAYTRPRAGQELTLTVKRDGRTLTLRATPVLSNVGGKEVGRLGVILDAARQRSDPLTAVGRAGIQVGSLVKAIFLRLGDIFGPTGLKRIGQLLSGAPRRVDDPASIVGGARIAGQAAEAGLWDALFEELVVFNVFVGMLNLIPLPPLDGGHLAVLAYEKVARRRPDVRKLVPLTALVAAFMILFVVSLVYLDIVRPLPNPFQ